MKHFQAVRKSLESLAIKPNHCNDQRYLFSRKYFILNLTYAFGVFSVSRFTFHSGNTAAEYMDSFFMLIVTGAIYLSYTISMFHMETLFRFFDQFLNDGAQF